MFAGLPLILAPLLVYDLVVLGFTGPTPGDPWVQPVFTLTLPSDGRFTLLTGDVLIVAALVCLTVDLGRRMRLAQAAPFDRALSVVVLGLHLLQFLTMVQAATSVFLVLMVTAVIDTVHAFARRRSGLGLPGGR